MLLLFKDITELLKKGATIEAQEKIMELREAVTELQEENQSLKEHIKKLEEELKIKGNVEWNEPYYMLKTETGEDGPFCQNCYDTQKKLIRLQGDERDVWKCYNCKSIFNGKNYQSTIEFVSGRKRAW